MQLYPEEEADVIELTRARCLSFPHYFFATLCPSCLLSTRDIAIPPALKRRMVQRHGVQVVVEAFVTAFLFCLCEQLGRGGGHCSRRGLQHGVAFSGDLTLADSTLNPY